MGETTDDQFAEGYFKIEDDIYEPADMKFGTNRNNNATIEANSPQMAAE